MSIKYKFNVGDIVEYTNPNGVNWGEKTIIGLDERTGKPTYYIAPTDTPWFSVSEEGLKLLQKEVKQIVEQQEQTQENNINEGENKMDTKIYIDSMKKKIKEGIAVKELQEYYIFLRDNSEAVKAYVMDIINN